jgi:hypothetical protein
MAAGSAREGHLCSADPFSIEVNPLSTVVPPILGELLAGYRITAVALMLCAVAPLGAVVIIWPAAD